MKKDYLDFIEKNFFKTKEEIIQWLDLMGIDFCEIIPGEYPYNYIVNCEEFINLSFKKIDFLPIKFGAVRTYFAIECNNLESMIGFPDECQNLIAKQNYIKNLDFLPKKCNEIDLSENCIQILDNINVDGLEKINFSKNEIELANISSSINTIDLSNNLLKKVKINKNLKIEKLYISNNQLIEIKDMPFSLKELIAYNNNIKEIDLLNNKELSFLHLDNNKIENFNGFANNYFNFLSIDNNPINNFKNMPYARELIFKDYFQFELDELRNNEN